MERKQYTNEATLNQTKYYKDNDVTLGRITAQTAYVQKRKFIYHTNVRCERIQSRKPYDKEERIIPKI